MQHQVGLGHFLERGPKRGDERVRQPVDEADRVRDEQLAPIRQTHLSHQRIERHEQRVGRGGRFIRQPVEQRRLAGVGVADERDGRHGPLLTPLPQLRSPLPHLIDLALNRLNPPANPPAVGLELRLARASRADAAAEARQRRRGADESREQILQLRELHLPLAFARPRATGEDVEYELRAIDDFPFELRFELTKLRGR